MCYITRWWIMYINLKNKDIDIKVCNNYFNRLIGYMFYLDPITNGLCFPNCNAVHTMFLYQPIDIAMTDNNNKILYLYQNVKPWRIINEKDVTTTYEFASGMLDEYSVGDSLKIKE